MHDVAHGRRLKNAGAAASPGSATSKSWSATSIGEAPRASGRRRDGGSDDGNAPGTDRMRQHVVSFPGRTGWYRRSPPRRHSQGDPQRPRSRTPDRAAARRLTSATVNGSRMTEASVNSQCAAVGADAVTRWTAACTVSGRPVPAWVGAPSRRPVSSGRSSAGAPPACLRPERRGHFKIVDDLIDRLGRQRRHRDLPVRPCLGQAIEGIGDITPMVPGVVATSHRIGSSAKSIGNARSPANTSGSCSGQVIDRDQERIRDAPTP